MNYRIHNLDSVTNPTTQESPQACAEHCAASEGCRFWTYNKDKKTCWLKTSDAEGAYLAQAISGSRGCGLSKQFVLSAFMLNWGKYCQLRGRPVSKFFKKSWSKVHLHRQTVIKSQICQPDANKLSSNKHCGLCFQSHWRHLFYLIT